MKTQLTREEIIQRMNHFDKDDFTLLAYDRIIHTKDREFALDLFESDGVFGLTIRDEWAGTPLGTDVLLAYKDVIFPVDIYHLYYTGNLYYSLVGLAIESCDDESMEGFMLFHRDMDSNAAFYQGFYQFCPELMDDTRLKFFRAISEIHECKLTHNYDGAATLCKGISTEIDSIVRSHAENALPSNDGFLDLSRYNNKLQKDENTIA